MVFNVNNYNLKNIYLEITKSKGINFTKKDNAKTYKKGKVINFRLSGIDNYNQYNLEFVLLSSLDTLNSFKENKLIKINEYIEEEVIIGINKVFDSSGYKYCDFFLEKIDDNCFKLNVYIKDYEFLSPRYNMFIELLIDYNEI